MPVAAALRRVAGDEMIHRLVGEERPCDIEHGEIDGLAMPGLGASCECGENGDGRVHARHQIDDGNADLLRAATGFAVALAGHAHQAAHGLDGEVVRGVLAPRTVPAEVGENLRGPGCCHDAPEVEHADVRQWTRAWMRRLSHRRFPSLWPTGAPQTWPATRPAAAGPRARRDRRSGSPDTRAHNRPRCDRSRTARSPGRPPPPPGGRAWRPP